MFRSRSSPPSLACLSGCVRTELLGVCTGPAPLPPPPARLCLRGLVFPAQASNKWNQGARPCVGPDVSLPVCFPAWDLGFRHGAEHVSPDQAPLAGFHSDGRTLQAAPCLSWAAGSAPSRRPGRRRSVLCGGWRGRGSLAPRGRASGLGPEAAGHVDVGLWGPGWRGPQEEQVGGLLASHLRCALASRDGGCRGAYTPGHCPGGFKATARKRWPRAWTKHRGLGSGPGLPLVRGEGKELP